MATPADFANDGPPGPAAAAGAEDVNAAFEAALRHEAAAAPAAIPAPPRATPSADPEAPHGRDDQGKPLAPFGTNQKTGRPNIKAPGPGRGGKKTDQPRTTSKVAAAARPKTPVPAGADYREDLSGLAMAIWMGGASLPATRPYAALWKDSMAGMVHAWNEAAQHNDTVRGYCEKLAGDGSWAWVIGVSVTTGPFLAGCWQLAKREGDPAKALERDQIKAQLAQRTEDEFKAYMTEQMALLATENAA